jgi:hypothetical protein
MGLARWTRKAIDRNRRSRKAISTIMANLTMLVIVVVLSSILFVWAVSSFGAYQGGAGYWFSSRSLANQERFSVEGAYFYSAGGTQNCALVYIRNVGTIPFTVASVYVNQTLYQAGYQFPALQINVSQVAPVIGNGGANSCGAGFQGLNMQLNGQTSAFVHGDTQTVTVATQRGTVVSTTWVT